MGPPDRRPAFPVLDTFDLPGYRLSLWPKYEWPCNWLQINDNNVDPVHTVFLHTRVSGAQFAAEFGELPEMEWQETSIGLIYIATRRLGGYVWVRINDTILPNIHQPPPEVEFTPTEQIFTRPLITIWRVPIDDTNTLSLGFMRVPESTPPDVEAQIREATAATQLPGRAYEDRQRKPGDYDAHVSARAIAIHALEHLDPDAASEFLVMAATLIHIKSRMLLPADEAAEDEEAEDPRLELVQRLLEYQAYRDAAVILREREEDAAGIFRREAAGEQEEPEEQQEQEELYLFDVNIFDLLTAFKRILDSAPPEVVRITRETLTVKDKMLHIVDIIENADSIRFEELFSGDAGRKELIVTFLALLELLRLGLARVYQEQEFGHIWIINPRRDEPAAGEASAV